MRTLRVVDHPPVVKPALTLGEVGKGAPADHLGLQSAVKPLIFALGLRMVGPAMADPDAELEQPHRQPGMAVQGIRAPRRAIVHQHAVGQPVAPEERRQLGLHRTLAFITAGPQPNRITRVVIDHRQRMAAPCRGRKMPLVVHLPQLVRRRPLKPLEGFVAGARHSVDATMPIQYRRDRAGARRRLVLQILQPAPDLAPTPGGMLVANRQHQPFDGRRTARRRVLRATRAIRQTALPSCR